MIQKDPQEQSLFDKANAAATNAMQSVVDLANRTRTPVIVFQNGKIERIDPSLLQDSQVDAPVTDQTQQGKTSH